MLLPRSQRSIFHLGEEGGGAADHGGGSAAVDVAHHQKLGGRNHGRRRERERERGWDADVVVGLQILVRQHGQCHRHPRPCHIVLKQMVSPPAPAPARRRSCFLGACSLCRRDLAPSKDVYMYRGDQGFCSEECRWQQMMADEAREREAMARRKERRGLHHHHHHGPRPPAAIRGAPRRPLAVA